MSRCHECGSRSQTKTYCSVSRTGGGNYKRASRNIRCIVCLDCIHNLLKDFNQTNEIWCNVGSHHYSPISLMYAAKVAAGDHTSLKERPYRHPSQDFLDIGAGI